MEYKLKTFQIQLTVSRIANIHYFEFTHNYNTKDDRHAFCELVYVDSGSLHIRAENFSGTLRENQMILHRADEMHSLACPEDSAPNVIIIGFACDSEALEPFPGVPYNFPTNSNGFWRRSSAKARGVPASYNSRA